MKYRCGCKAYVGGCTGLDSLVRKELGLAYLLTVDADPQAPRSVSDSLKQYIYCNAPDFGRFGNRKKANRRS